MDKPAMRSVREALTTALKAAQADASRTATPDLIREASNVLWSADNGGWNGRPSEIKRVLRKLVDALEGEMQS